jgi:PAS domain-containing protein
MNDAFLRHDPAQVRDGDHGDADASGRSDGADALAGNGEARFRAMAELLPSMVFETDATGANIWCSAAWVRYTGLDRGQLADAGWQAVIHPDDLAASRAAWPLAVATGG